MIRYLSAAWFERLRDDTSGPTAPAGATGDSSLVLRHVVRAGSGAVAGETVDYDVVVGDGRAVIRHPSVGTADLTFTSDWDTAVAIAGGRLSTRAALAAGRLRVGGDVSLLSSRAPDVAGVDPVPAGLRAETDFRP